MNTIFLYYSSKLFLENEVSGRDGFVSPLTKRKKLFRLRGPLPPKNLYTADCTSAAYFYYRLLVVFVLGFCRTAIIPHGKERAVANQQNIFFVWLIEGVSTQQDRATVPT